ncbi:MAG: c-type cytochrome [Roseibacillus sp.]
MPPSPKLLALASFAALLLPLSGEPGAKKKGFDPKMDKSTSTDSLHPLFQLENLYPTLDVELKISAMAFDGEDLYLTVFTPDRQNKAPFKEGEVYRVTGLIGNSDRAKVKAQRLMGDLYEPTAITTVAGKIYIGEKDKISRLEDRNGDGLYTTDEKVVLIDGLSQPNFHTYTVGFETLVEDNKTYLVGNLTTSIRLGGSRERNLTVNPKTKRGSTFLFGPITGTETPEQVDITYYAGGYRTPNGIGMGADNEIIVTDNQGVFNPTNEFLRLSKGSFHGHYLLADEETNTAAFQPAEVDSTAGGSRYQTPPTVHLPQGIVNRSPTQPLQLNDLPGPFAPYNGQWLIGDLTLGRLNRVFLEEVEGVWQGAVFLHSGGHDPEGRSGFTAGPNRIVQGPDKNYYLGHIGDGGLWRFLPKPGEDPKPLHGLQRLSWIDAEKVPADFNEMVAVRDHVGGLQIDLFQAITPEQLEKTNFALKQWTYVPTKGYGGRNFGTEKLSETRKSLSPDGKTITLEIPGIRDNSPPYLTQGKYSNENVGWVIEVKLNNLPLYKDTAWYTMVHHQGGGSHAELATDKFSLEEGPLAYAEAQYKAICAACHTLDGTRLAGPAFNGILGRKQEVIRDGKTVKVTIDKPYLLQSITDPLAEYPVGYPPAMPNLALKPAEAQAMVDWLSLQK